MEASEDRKDESHILDQAEADSSDSLLRFLLPVLVILVGALLFGNLKPTEYDEFVGQAFDHSGTSYHGDVVDLKDYKGSVVVVNFWATYCPYCLEDIEHLKELNEELRHDDFQIVGVSSDLREELDAFFTQKPDLPWPTYFGEDAFKLGTAYKVDSIPRVMLLDRDGKIVAAARAIDDIKRRVYQLVHNG
ncbi:MAG: TlpA family protein disulfide reductase [Pirellulales bacterium]|nr:TlpA family protein disulfide reductase [Pirellulales bacterium]